MQVIDVDLPHTRYALATYYTIATAESSSNLARYDGLHYGVYSSVCRSVTNQATVLSGFSDARKNAEDDLYVATRSQAFGDEVQRRIFVGSFVLSSQAYSAYYEKAQRVRHIIQQELCAVLDPQV